MIAPLPYLAHGMSVGLFGGTFDPPHAGHVLAASRALRRVDLDQIWWMPSPGNPLKSRQPTPMQQRIELIRARLHNPHMKVHDLEAKLRTRYTIDTYRALQRRYPSNRFVLIFGSDILTEFHRWRHWQELAMMAPICTIARPKEQLRAGLSPFAQRFARYRIEPEEAPLLRVLPAPCWTILPGPMIDLSSTKLRKQNRAKHGGENSAE